ncbi:MAG: BtpA/SgcQ family protein [Caldilineaceae bacterium]
MEIAHREEEANAQAVLAIKEANPNLPVIFGGYTNHENAVRRLAHADGAFVGSCFETGGWGSRVDKDRVAAYMEIVGRL